MLGIIGAMDVEVKELREMMEHPQAQTVAGMTFYQGKIKGKEVVVVRSGIGKVNAGICSQILVDRYNVEGIINTGIAGSLRNEINIGDIVLATVAVQHDVDATGFGYPIGEIPQMGIKEFPADDTLRELAIKCCKKANPDIQTFSGRVASGDQFISSKEKKNWIQDNFDAYCTEMEGAAIAQAAYLNNIPYLVIRAISDKADDSANMDYSEFEAKAVENSVRLMAAMLEEM
ncbi:MAG: 5'-methylthioadenosine/adenosylhomocysteine nucleosidase [Lachnospiraceae bacterium]|nr:5'-methylthioadenosine/adenosylhomocysteine nucleosidase [Lachnospiraceae bacterium]